MMRHRLTRRLITLPAVFLAAAASDYVTGQIICVDGGFTSAM